jgi:hypothetical protein
MVDWINILNIHIYREEASFQRREEVSPVSLNEEDRL